MLDANLLWCVKHKLHSILRHLHGRFQMTKDLASDNLSGNRSTAKHQLSILHRSLKFVWNLIPVEIVDIGIFHNVEGRLQLLSCISNDTGGEFISSILQSKEKVFVYPLWEVVFRRIAYFLRNYLIVEIVAHDVGIQISRDRHLSFIVTSRVYNRICGYSNEKYHLIKVR